MARKMILIALPFLGSACSAGLDGLRIDPQPISGGRDVAVYEYSCEGLCTGTLKILTDPVDPGIR